MHAIARRIAAKLTSRRRNRDHHEYEEEPQLIVYVPNALRQATPQFIPFVGHRSGILGWTNTPITIEIEETNDSNTFSNGSNKDSNRKLGLLYRLAKAWAWPALAHRCRTHPWEASSSVVNHDGDTALHWAVFGNPPLFVVEALLRASPELVNVPNATKQLPLHLACCYRASPEVLQALVELNPSNLGVRNGLGFYPLHILCDCGCLPACLEIVLKYEEAIGTLREKDYTYDRTPLYILNQRKNLALFGRQVEMLRRLRQDQRDALRHGNWTENDQRRLEAKLTEYVEMEFWCKSRMLIIAEYKHFGRQSRTDNHGTVQACLSINECPPSLLEYAILAYGEELVIPDGHGNLPLHYACAGSVGRKETQWLVLEILNATVQAARVPGKSRRLPLEIFVSNSTEKNLTWSEALKQLILAHTAAIDVLQIDHLLYPFILERLGCNKDTASEIFQLLRASPGLFSNFANHSFPSH
jgi:hypothetical protein